MDNFEERIAIAAAVEHAPLHGRLVTLMHAALQAKDAEIAELRRVLVKVTKGMKSKEITTALAGKEQPNV
jgi:hypothetical protein